MRIASLLLYIGIVVGIQMFGDVSGARAVSLCDCLTTTSENDPNAQVCGRLISSMPPNKVIEAHRHCSEEGNRQQPTVCDCLTLPSKDPVWMKKCKQMVDRMTDEEAKARYHECTNKKQ